MEQHHHYQDYQQYPPPLPPPQYQPPPPQQQQQHYDYGTTVSHIPPPPPPQHYPYNPHPHHPYNYGETVSHMHPPPMPPPHQYPPPSYPPHPHHNQHHYGETVSHMNHHHHPQQRRQHRPSSKRPRETGVDFGGETVLPSTKRQAIGNDVLFRVVVPSGHIGKVIGKGGHRVQKVRDDTKATIKIADPIARFEERVIIINSKEKSDGGMTDAEKALLQIAALILVDDGSTALTLSSSSADPNAAAAATTAASAGHVATNSVKLLIAGSQAGGLIGVSGQNIEKIRSSSGAAIAVLAPNQVPMCASAHDSDRLVQISGESPAVLKAVEEIGVELRANPPKQVISISPTYNLSITRGAQPHMDPYAAECVTLDMVISETMVGGLIGRAGSNIARIRNESGAMIKVFGGKGELKHRQIQLIGTAEQVALAKQRVDEYVYTQLTQSGGDE